MLAVAVVVQTADRGLVAQVVAATATLQVMPQQELQTLEVEVGQQTVAPLVAALAALVL
jgi:hypothetical protein